MRDSCSSTPPARFSHGAHIARSGLVQRTQLRIRGLRSPAREPKGRSLETATSLSCSFGRVKRKKQKTRKQRRALRADRGYPYQHLVAETARAFDPRATVEQGEWVDGPDGRLDLDVAIRWDDDGVQRLCVIECKDYDVSTTGKVGRPIVDALESKRRDLKADHSLICSNSGFTADALRKAQRVGIGMISVLRSGDDRVKFVVEQVQHICRITVRDWQFSYTFQEGRFDLQETLAEPRYQGLPTNKWLVSAAEFVAIANPGCATPLACTFRFRDPLPCQIHDVDVTVLEATVQFSYQAQWFARPIRIDLTNGIYDHIRSTARMAPGLNTVSHTPIEGYPEVPCAPAEVSPPRPPGPGEVDMSMMVVQNVPQFEEACPNLAPLIVPEDLTLHLDGKDFCRNDRERRSSDALRGFTFQF